MKKLWKLITWVIKVILMLVLLGVALCAWCVILFVQGGLMGPGPSGVVLLLDVVFIIATIALYIFICKMIIRFSMKNSVSWDDWEDFRKK